jgi:hypothetical protein
MNILNVNGSIYTALIERTKRSGSYENPKDVLANTTCRKFKIIVYELIARR